VRYTWFASHLTQQTLDMQLDKWQVGPLRVVNLVAFACVIYWSRKLLTRLFVIEPFVMLGKASLQVFCAIWLSSFSASRFCMERPASFTGSMPSA
jgi:hypothetical protein